MKVLVGPARAWASIAPPEPGASLEWSGTPSSINVAIGGSYNAAQHVVYDGEDTLTYSSIGTSLSGTGISLNTSTGVLSVSGEASAGTVGGIQIRVSDGTLTADSPAFSVTKQSSTLVLDLPGSISVNRVYGGSGSGLMTLIELSDYVTYAGGGSPTYSFVGGKPSVYLSLIASTGRLFVGANALPMSVSVTVQVTDGTHTESGTFTLNVSVPGYQPLKIVELAATQVASRNGRLDIGFHTLYDGAGTLAYSSIGSALPAGATLNASTGLISLSAVSVGTTSGIQIRVTDGTHTADSSVFALQVVDEDLIYPDDLTWLGAFRMPSGMELDYASGCIGVDPAGNGGAGSIFVPGHPWYNLWGEISIPTLVASTSKGSLNRASQLQAMIDALEGTIGEISPPSHQLGGALALGSELVLTAYQYYGTSQTKTHWIRPRNLSTTGSLTGPVESEYSGSVPWNPDIPESQWPHRTFAGAMARIPAALQSAFGGKAVAGHTGLTNVAAESAGPCAFVFDPDDIGETTPLPFVGALGYPQSRGLGLRLGVPSDTHRSVSFNQTTVIRGIVIPSGRDSVLFVGRQRRGEYWYGEPWIDADQNDTNWGYDPNTGHSNKGPNARGHQYQVWAYRRADLLAVTAGTKAHWEPLPYAMWKLDLPLYDRAEPQDVSASFDEATNRIYLHCNEQDGTLPITHVMEIE